MFNKLLSTVAGIAIAVSSVSAINVDFCFGWNVQKCGHITNPSIPLMNTGAINVACNNCHLETKGTLEFDIHPLEETLKIGFENLEIDFVGELDASASGQWSFDKSEYLTVFKGTLIDTRVGILPVHIWMEVPITVGLRGQFSGTADGKIGIAVRGTVGNWDAEYDHGWKHVYPNSTFDITHTLDATIQADGGAAINIQPQIIIHVDDIFEGEIVVNQMASIYARLNEGGGSGIAENSELKCSLCKWVAEEAEQLLLSNHTLNQIETVLNGACKKLQSLSEICDTVVQQYLPMILEFLESKAQPPVICQKLGLCDSAVSIDDRESGFCAKATETLNIDWRGEIKLDWFHYDKKFDVKLVKYVKSFPFSIYNFDLVSETGHNLTE